MNLHLIFLKALTKTEAFHLYLNLLFAFVAIQQSLSAKNHYLATAIRYVMKTIFGRTVELFKNLIKLYCTYFSTGSINSWLKV